MFNAVLAERRIQNTSAANFSAGATVQQYKSMLFRQNAPLREMKFLLPYTATFFRQTS
jgi:hypothetical protein